MAAAARLKEIIHQLKTGNRTVLLSLAAAGLLFVLPYLSPRHYYPLPAFYAELAAGVLLLLAGVILLPRATWTRPLIPAIALLPLSLGALAVLQGFFGHGGTHEAQSMFLLYMFGAAFAMVTGKALQQESGLPKLAHILASFLLVGTLVCAVLAMFSLYAPGVTHGLVQGNMFIDGARGPLMQRNHLANYLWTGVMAASFLYTSGRLNRYWLMGALLPLLLLSVMTASKAPLAYLIASTLLALLWWYRDRASVEARRFLRVMTCLVPAFLVIQAVVPSLPTPSFEMTGFKAQGERLLTGNDRFGEDLDNIFGKEQVPNGSLIHRIHMSKVAFAIFRESPLLGTGVGNYSWGSFRLAEQFPDFNPGHSEHAHNLLLQLLAELGIGGLIVLLVCVTLWGRRFIAQKWNSAHVWLASVLMVQAVHSLLEYPLWFAYFLLPAALLIGAADTRAATLRPSRSLRGAAIAFLVIGAMVLNVLRSDYLRLEHAFNPALEGRTRFATFAELNPVLLNLEQYSLFAPYVRLLYAGNLKPGDGLLEEKLMMTNSAMRFSPIPQVVFKHALLLALAERQEEAQQQLRWSMRGYPQLIWNFYEIVEERQAKDPSLPYTPLIAAAKAELVRRGEILPENSGD